jgi:hypothetical protein
MVKITHTYLKAMRIYEVSPNTLSGSFEHSLVFSKLWLCQEIKNIMLRSGVKKFHTVYVLGSWYGNMGFFLMARNVPFRKLINVDKNANVLRGSFELAKQLGVEDKIQFMLKNANTLDYRQAKFPSLIINTSTNDMTMGGWFQNIPRNTLVALQGRNNAKSTYEFKNLEQFSAKFPLRRTMFLGGAEMQDPETKYTRFMKIGIR